MLSIGIGNPCVMLSLLEDWRPILVIHAMSIILLTALGVNDALVHPHLEDAVASMPSAFVYAIMFCLIRWRLWGHNAILASDRIATMHETEVVVAPHAIGRPTDDDGARAFIHDLNRNLILALSPQDVATLRVYSLKTRIFNVVGYQEWRRQCIVIMGTPTELSDDDALLEAFATEDQNLQLQVT
eukprot:CAMPEP_0180520006 /NCGR_PEP_ID=MMETSP1036_2-20121128/56015_1 /TAXON_ID=632150 /ORGANISM="Azadinium spinosum, Strain 3D9" /LENGTH=184 /DNA_ID=CAMNT_0022532431 /DNA_START=92 /DNA_END=642 /DNA_ORIENTATION=-